MIRISGLLAIATEPNAKVASGLLLAFVALLPAEPLYNAPLIALAILGTFRLISRRVRLDSPENRFLCIAFLCMWLPMLASLPDAVNSVEAVRKTASLCLYFLAGVYVVGAYIRFRELDWIMTGTAAVCIFWSLDALWQFQTGTDWFGIPYEEGERLTGIFHTGRIGYLLASFAPFVFETVRRSWRRWWWSPVLLVPYLMTIVLSGSRTSWVALAIATVGYLLFLIRWSDRPPTSGRRWKPSGIAAVLAAMVLAGLLSAHAWPGGMERIWKAVEPRVESLTGLWSGDREQFERAVTWRLSIWMTAVNMWSNHWLNGVGPRGFHYAYGEYNPEKDYYLLYGDSHGAATSPHLQLLEIATETGVIGLLGYVALAVAFFTRLRTLKGDSFRSAYPYALTLIVALFPFSGHLGFYGVLSAGIIWWMVIVCASAFAVAPKAVPDP